MRYVCKYDDEQMTVTCQEYFDCLCWLVTGGVCEITGGNTHWCVSCT